MSDKLLIEKLTEQVELQKTAEEKEMEKIKPLVEEKPHIGFGI